MNKRRIIEWGKNLLIVALLCSAVWLLIDSQLFVGKMPWTLTPQPSGVAEQESVPVTGQVVLPLGVAVTNSAGVCAARYDGEAITALVQPLLPVLGEAMAGASQAEEIDRQQWQQALHQPGNIWLELQGNVPMQVLCYWLAGVENSALTGSARQLALCARQGQVYLYYRQGEQYWRCAADGVSAEYLQTVLAQAVPNGIQFADGRPEYAAVDPQTLILEQLPQPPEYVAINPLDAAEKPDTLLEALSFAPEVTTVYQTPEGQRARSGNDTLTISNTGQLSYECSGEEQRYPLAGSTEGHEAFWATETARKLVCGVTERWGGTQIYLRDVRQESDGWRVEFGYVIDGIPVQLGAQGWAASVLVGAQGVEQYEICLRSYQPTGETTLLLPQPQAAAILEQMGHEGSGLLLSYLDGGGTVRAGWMADE